MEIQVFNPTDDQPLLVPINLVVQTISGTASKRMEVPHSGKFLKSPIFMIN